MFVTLCDFGIHFYFLSFSTSEATDGTPRHPPSIQRIRALFGEKVILQTFCKHFIIFYYLKKYFFNFLKFNF